MGALRWGGGGDGSATTVVEIPEAASVHKI